MQFKLTHIFYLTTFAATSLVAYLKLPHALGADGVFGKLGIGSVIVGLFMCFFVIYMLRLPATQRSGIRSESSDVIYDGQHWLDFLFVWIVGSLFVFIGGYSFLSDMNDHPLPLKWWTALIPAGLLLVAYFPTWRFLRKI